MTEFLNKFEKSQCMSFGKEDRKFVKNKNQFEIGLSLS